ncbi:MAG: SCP2 sterol-binding domain-containing protein [Pikeienuella sp.]
MGVADLAESLKEKVEGGSFDSSIKFDCGDDGVLVIDNQSISTTDQAVDCTVTVELSDLESIVAGDLDPTAAFMQGKLSVDGDMGVAMKLGQVL